MKPKKSTNLHDYEISREDDYDDDNIPEIDLPRDTDSYQDYTNEFDE